MFDVQLFLPVLAQIAITVALAIPTAGMRWRDALTRKVRRRDVSLGQRAWPELTQRVSNAFNNQWESPTLFYAGVAFAMIAGEGGQPLVGLAWAYVVTRVVHALIYVTTNFVPLRFLVFLIGGAFLIAFWGVLASRVLGGG